MERVLPKVIFEKLSYKENLEMFVWFIVSENNKGPLNTRKIIFDRYPQFIYIAQEYMNYDETYMAINEEFEKIYNENIPNIEKALLHFQNIWDKYNDDIMRVLEERVECNWDNDLIIKGRIGILPVAPRDIRNMTFDIDFEKKSTYVITTVIHECMHYVYFKKFKELYPGLKEEQMDNPYIEWILSEAVIDPLLNHKDIQGVYKNKFKSYEIFYNIEISGKNLMDNLKIIYKQDIVSAIKESYSYFKHNEIEIKKALNYKEN